MHHLRLTPSRLVLAAVAATALIGGAAYAASTTMTASKTDNLVSSTANTNISTTGGVWTPILTMQLPTSTSHTQWVLSASGDIVNFGPSDYTRCQIVVNGIQIAAESTIVGDPNQSGAEGPAPFVSPFSLTGGADAPKSGGIVHLNCEHDHSNGAGPYVDAGVALLAHQTTSLSLATEP